MGAQSEIYYGDTPVFSAFRSSLFDLQAGLAASLGRQDVTPELKADGLRKGGRAEQALR